MRQPAGPRPGALSGPGILSTVERLRSSPKGSSHAEARPARHRYLVGHRPGHGHRRRSGRLRDRGHPARSRARRGPAVGGGRGGRRPRRPHPRRDRRGGRRGVRRRGGGRPRSPRRLGQQRRGRVRGHHRAGVDGGHASGHGGQLLQRRGHDQGGAAPPAGHRRQGHHGVERGRGRGPAVQRGLLRRQVRRRGVPGEPGPGGRDAWA